MSQDEFAGIRRVGRRLFLRGAAGAVVGLPLLESLFAPRTRAQDMKHRYAIFMRQANGVAQATGNEPERFWPTKLGALTTASMNADGDQAVNVLADYASSLLLVRGVEMKALTDAGCGHSQGGLLCLTAARANGKNIEKALATGESIDNRIVRELDGAGKDPLTLRAGVRSSYLDDVLSYRGAGDRRVAESNPYNAYKALFGASMMTPSTGGGDAARRKSVNDLVRGEMARLLAHPKLSKADKERLEQHRQAIRDLETTMQCNLPPEMLDPLSKVTTKQAESDALVVETARMQAQVIALAMSCGRTHAATLQIGNGNDQTQYTINGTKYERFHHISHRINSDGSSGTPIENAAAKHHDIDKLIATIFKNLLAALDSYKTPTGSLLDEGVSVWLNDLSTGPAHATQNMPYVCAGSCGGALKTGVYVEAATGRTYVTHNKFLNTIGAAVGCKTASGAPLDDFGDPSLAKGQIPQMKV